MAERLAKKRHDWLLAGPWYRRQSLGGGAVERPQQPIIQKYASSDFASEIIGDPEHSLRFVGEDFINNLSLPANDPVSPATPGVANNSLKLFLASHSRFYIVVCELHCDAPGYPNVAREQVAEAGFVVRRFTTQLDEGQRQALQPVLKKRALLQARINRVQRGLKGLYSKPSSGPGKLALRNGMNKKQSAKLAELNAQLLVNSQALQAIRAEHKIDVETQGWFESQHQGIGQWDPLDDEVPQDLQEQSFPLYPLIADPTQNNHAAEGRSMWYGVIPTQSADVDVNDNPRFDDTSAYEIRCFVRRQPDCAEDDEECCPGEIVWSEGTESYRLAAFYDLDGCGHKPINIKMPDLDNLKQQVARGPAGKGANVRVTTPDNSSLVTAPGEDFAFPEGGSPGNGAICFFAIPLITIVAMFLLRLVLPIVVFLFNLWFLLSLRLCIPPSLSLDAGVAADLKLIPPEFDFEAEFDAGVSLQLGGAAFAPVESLDDLADLLKPAIDSDPSMNKDTRDAMIESVRNNQDVFAIVNAVADAATDFAAEPVGDAPPPRLPTASDGLHYFDPVGVTT